MEILLPTHSNQQVISMCVDNNDITDKNETITDKNETLADKRSFMVFCNQPQGNVLVVHSINVFLCLQV